MIDRLRSFKNEELERISKRASVVRIENKKNAEYTVTKKSVKTISDDFTALQNSFNKIRVNMSNIKALQNAQSKTPLPENILTPVGGNIIGIDDFSVKINTLGKFFERFTKQFKELDLSPNDQQGQEGQQGQQTQEGQQDQEEIDIDIKKKKRAGGRRTRSRGFGGRSRGGRLGIFGKALGIASDAIGTTFGVVGKSLGIASDAIGTTFDVVGKSVGVVGKGLKIAGTALGVLGGGYLASKVFGSSQADKNLVSATSKAVAPPAKREPTPISNNSYSSRFANYLSDTFENVTGYIGKTVGGVLGATGLLGDYGPPAGSTKNAQIAMEFFMSPEGGGWTREQAAGIVGNLQGESSANLNPNAVGDGGNAYGIAQWNQQVSPDRVANFKNVIGTDLRSSNLQQQLQFVTWELQNSEKAAGNKLRNAKDVESATIAMSYYERYKGYKEELGSSVTRQRISNAQALMAQQSQVVDVGKLGKLANPFPAGKFSGPGIGQEREGGRRSHQGLDIFGPMGAPIYAMADGTVVYSERRSGDGGGSGFGLAVQIRHDNGLITKYAHLSELAGLNKDDRVSSGQLIGYNGDTGNAKGTPPHLHFEVWQGERMVEPASILSSIATASSSSALAKKTIKDFPILPPSRKGGNNSFIMINGKRWPTSTPPQILFPYAGGKGGAAASNLNSREAMIKYHGL